MRILFYPLITLPFIATAFCSINPAKAETFTPIAAIELLSKSKASDAKCRYLAGDESQELSDYLARAEIAAATQTSVAETQAAITTGRAAGSASLCGPQSLADVRATLNAAREAMASLASVEETAEKEPVAAPEPVKVIAKAPEQKVKSVRLLKAATAAKKQTQPGSLNTYAAAAIGYYVDQRCHHLSASQVRRYYAGILRRHHSALAATGKKAVGDMLRNAEARAGTVSCGARSAALVKGSFARAVN